MQENNTIKNEIAKEVDDFEKALLERNKVFKVEGHWTQEEIDAAMASMANSHKSNKHLGTTKENLSGLL